ncbi:hypothetical protein GCM10025787_15770 [Saccharopolyspora rosea]
MESTTSSGTTAPPEHAPVAHRWRNLATLSGIMIDTTEAGVVTTLFPSIAAALRLGSGHLGVVAALGKLVAVPAGPAWV